MTQEQFKREKAYHITLCIARAMFQCGLINEREYKKIDTMMLNKYRPILGSLLR